jgi:hypothetical protein
MQPNGCALPATVILKAFGGNLRLDANRAPVLSKLVLLLVLACAQCVAADAPLPAEASFLRGLMELPSKYEAWNETTFPPTAENFIQGSIRELREVSVAHLTAPEPGAV